MNTTQFLHWCQSFSSDSDKAHIYRRKPLIMGILNITPDSFSDGGVFLDVDVACSRAKVMLEDGVDIIDVGGESTRPGARAVPLSEELSRVIPVIESIRAMSDVCISIDTSKPAVMAAAVKAGASMINDVRALREDNALSTAAALHVPVCLMHARSVPASLEPDASAKNLVEEMNLFFSRRLKNALAAGICREHLILDPGFGFKSPRDSLGIIRHLNRFLVHGCPLLLGFSRKRTIGAVLKKTVSERMLGGLALTALAAYGGVSMIRTHDINETNQVLQMVDAVMRSEEIT